MTGSLIHGREYISPPYASRIPNVMVDRSIIDAEVE